VSHARNRGIFADRIKNVGKRPLVASGKYPVNEIDEEIGKPCEGETVVARNALRRRGLDPANHDFSLTRTQE
jgi:hypothetical protein